eukprot:COSAG01_NODE_94_length_26962_cov_9.110933_25_plen_78_part_00
MKTPGRPVCVAAGGRGMAGCWLAAAGLAAGPCLPAGSSKNHSSQICLSLNGRHADTCECASDVCDRLYYEITVLVQP